MRLVEDNVLVLLIPMSSLGVAGGGDGSPKTSRMNNNKGKGLLFGNFGGMNSNIRNGTSKKLTEGVT